MSENQSTTTQVKAPARRLGPEEVVLGSLAVLSIGGMAIADFSARWGLWYWLAMVPIFVAASLFTGWARARRRGETAFRILRRQLLHWATLPLAVYLVYVLEQTGRLNREDAGLVALLALALTTALAGVHFDWRLGVLGALLGITAASAALVEEFFWVLLIPAVAAAAIAILWHRRGEGAREGGG
jgi:hypothetical protein